MVWFCVEPYLLRGSCFTRLGGLFHWGSILRCSYSAILTVTYRYYSVIFSISCAIRKLLHTRPLNSNKLYFLVIMDLPWVQHPYFLYGSGTLILSTRVPHPHFLVIKFLHQRDILFSMVHVHSDIGYKITNFSGIVFKTV